MPTPDPTALETDPRFPSGPWIGFYQQPPIPGRQWMELHLTFQGGELSGEGRDPIGRFVVQGKYDLTDGKCHWTKHYVGQHDVQYQGFNEGKGIWGTWKISLGNLSTHGGFHIWPKGTADPTGSTLHEQADVPVHEETEVKHEAPEPVGAPG